MTPRTFGFRTWRGVGLATVSSLTVGALAFCASRGLLRSVALAGAYGIVLVVACGVMLAACRRWPSRFHEGG